LQNCGVKVGVNEIFLEFLQRSLLALLRTLKIFQSGRKHNFEMILWVLSDQAESTQKKTKRQQPEALREGCERLGA